LGFVRQLQTEVLSTFTNSSSTLYLTSRSGTPMVMAGPYRFVVYQAQQLANWAKAHDSSTRFQIAGSVMPSSLVIRIIGFLLPHIANVLIWYTIQLSIFNRGSRAIALSAMVSQPVIIRAPGPKNINVFKILYTLKCSFFYGAPRINMQLQYPGNDHE